jgi:cellulose synthase/poly-beta-1,6-N-acetylglucosamine synthase-like glycosyltransferase
MAEPDTPAPVSVVIPCRNAAEYLGEAIASVRAQTRAIDELIVVDDQSTDGSAELAESLGATLLRPVERCGAAGARNLGLEHARHEFVAFLDADDVWLPRHCACVVPLVEGYPEVAAAFGALQVTYGPMELRAGARLNIPWVDEGRPQRLFERCLSYWIGQPSTCVIRKSAALSVGGFDQSMVPSEDFDLWLRLSTDWAFAATHEVTALWRRHPSQISNQVARQIELCFRARRQAVHRLEAAGNSSGAARAVTIIRQAYERALLRAAAREDVAALLAFSDLVPGGDAIRRRWERRLALPRPLSELWLRRGRRVEQRGRELVRRVGARLARV